MCYSTKCEPVKVKQGHISAGFKEDNSVFVVFECFDVLSKKGQLCITDSESQCISIYLQMLLNNINICSFVWLTT